MPADSIIKQAVLETVPQQAPFRFIDSILELEPDRIVSSYTFRENEYFYSGHFKDNPVTPGVILIETMAQTGVVALGIYQLMEQGLDADLRIE